MSIQWQLNMSSTSHFCPRFSTLGTKQRNNLKREEDSFAHLFFFSFAIWKVCLKNATQILNYKGLLVLQAQFKSENSSTEAHTVPSFFMHLIISDTCNCSHTQKSDSLGSHNKNYFRTRKSRKCLKKMTLCPLSSYMCIFFLPVIKTHHSKCYVQLDLNPEGRN